MPEKALQRAIQASLALREEQRKRAAALGEVKCMGRQAAIIRTGYRDGSLQPEAPFHGELRESLDALEQAVINYSPPSEAPEKPKRGGKNDVNLS